MQLQDLQLTSLQLIEGHFTTEEEFEENDRLWSIADSLEIVVQAYDKFQGTTYGQIDRNPQTLEKLEPLDVKAVVQYIIVKDLYLGEGHRGVKITVIIDPNEVPIATYVKMSERRR